jgi:hypothetical protein
VKPLGDRVLVQSLEERTAKEKPQEGITRTCWRLAASIRPSDTRTALQNAASISALMLTTRCIGDWDAQERNRLRWHGRYGLLSHTIPRSFCEVPEDHGWRTGTPTRLRKNYERTNGWDAETSLRRKLEIARLKDEITELTKHVQLGAEHKKDPIWAMIKAEMANQGYRKGYDQAMEKSHQLEDRLQKRGAELEQLLGECIRHQYIDEAPRVKLLADSR